MPIPVTEQSIIQYADSLDVQTNTMEKHQSLVYNLGENSLYVEKYSTHGSPVVYKKSLENEGLSSSEKRYYFNNDTLVLIRELDKQIKQNTESFAEIRTFFRNNVAFKKDIRTALSASTLTEQQFSPLKQVDLSGNDYAADIKMLNDALDGNDKFDLVFDSFLSAPNERYILLKSKIPNGYSANIQVTESDALIDSIIAEPIIFKDQKLKFKWEMKDKEPVYVPVEVSDTSANGLKR